MTCGYAVGSSWLSSAVYGSSADFLRTGCGLTASPSLRSPPEGRVTDPVDLEHLVHRARRDHLDPVAMAQLAVDNPHVGDDTAVGVVDRVEDQRAGRRVSDTDGGRR